MIVGNANGLHKSIDDGGSNKSKSALLKIFRDEITDFTSRLVILKSAKLITNRFSLHK